MVYVTNIVFFNRTAAIYLLSSGGITNIEKGTTYRASSGGSHTYLVTNGVTGTIKTTYVSGTDSRPPTILYKDGTTASTSFGTFALTKDMVALVNYDNVNHVASYDFVIN